MVEFHYNGTNDKMYAVVNVCNRLIKDAQFWDKWHKIKYFNPEYTSISIDAPAIFDMFTLYNVRISLFAYRSSYWNRKVNAYTLPKQIGKVWLNTRRLDRSIAFIASTLMHEACHTLDAMNETAWFGHGTNTPKNTHDREFNHGCVPEVMADIVYAYLQEGITID